MLSLGWFLIRAYNPMVALLDDRQSLAVLPRVVFAILWAAAVVLLIVFAVILATWGSGRATGPATTVVNLGPIFDADELDRWSFVANTLDRYPGLLNIISDDKVAIPLSTSADYTGYSLACGEWAKSSTTDLVDDVQHRVGGSGSKSTV